MDVATHALTSVALARAFFPRKGWPVLVGMLAAGTLADVDLLSSVAGPSAYLIGHRTWTHSLLVTIVVIAIAAILAKQLDIAKKNSLMVVLGAMVCASLAHLSLDLLQSDGVMLLWPIRTTRFAADFLPGVDGWIVALLLAGILMPELFLLVGSEIGAKEKHPRGRNGALVALALIAAYIGARGVLHANSLALLEPRSYQRESPRRLGSLPDSLSIFTWHGVVETESLICLVDVPMVFGKGFDPETASCLHKPQTSPELNTALNTSTVKAFLQVARFPRAAVAKTEEGHEVTIRSMRDQAVGETLHRVAVRVTMDTNYKLLTEEFIWAADLRLK